MTRGVDTDGTVVAPRPTDQVSGALRDAFSAVDGTPDIFASLLRKLDRAEDRARCD